MRKLFNFNRSEDETVNSLVECSLDLMRASYEGKQSADYADKNKQLLEGIGKKIVENTPYAAKYEAQGLSVFKNPQVNKNTAVRDNFNAILAETIGCIIPEVTNDQFEGYIAEIHHGGWGETAVFEIESNDLFKVNAKAEGVRKGVDQPMFDDEVTVNATGVTIDAAIDWYPFAAGKFDMGNFGAKIARSFAAYIFLKAVKGMTQASTDFGDAYRANGVTPQLWGNLKAKVEAANGGMKVVAIGTDVALSNVNLSGNYQVEIGEEMTKVGYLSQYLSTPLIAIKNVLIPGTTNTTATLALPNNIIYMVPVAGSRPVKIYFEGEQVTVDFDPENTSDKRYGISVELRVGVSAICGPKYGTITLA